MFSRHGRIMGECMMCGGIYIYILGELSNVRWVKNGDVLEFTA